MSQPHSPHSTEPCPVCGRSGYVPGSLLAVLLAALSPLLGGLAALLLDWWWLLALTLTGWTLAVIIAVAGASAAARDSYRIPPESLR